ncbi:DUF6174 domain-containing protein [Thiofilum flexile]|uniref:DUF6174 domain-containing protein n=1 Tax=Thiofilum flexile TaxID=125627 RepID=UPI000380942E|nr:DUF6174 domain-containing protein [Thiofilum flexile]
MSTINTTRINIPRTNPTTVAASNNAATNRTRSTTTAPIPTTLSTPVQNITQQTTAQVGQLTPTPVVPIRPTTTTGATGFTSSTSVPVVPGSVGIVGPGVVWSTGPATAAEARQQLSDARTRWANKGITNYSLSLNNFSEAIGTGGSATVDVINGQAVSASNPYSTVPVDTALAKLTVNDLFDLAEKAINAGNFSNLYFDDRGIPTNIRIGDKQYSAYLQSIIIPATAGNDTVTIATPSYQNPTTGEMIFNPSDSKTYWGGEGQDTAVFSGKLSDYSIQTQSDGSIIVAPFNGQPATIKGFETLRFADTSMTKEQLTDPAQMLNYRRQQWQSQGLNNYSLIVSKSTGSEPSSISSTTPIPILATNFQTAQLDIVNGRVLNANAMENSNNNTPLSPDLANMTVDNLFDMAQQAINRGEKVDIQYDYRGIPNSVRIGSTHYSAHIQSKIVAGTTGDDNFTAQFTSYPSTMMPYTELGETRYVGNSGNDTLKINGRLQDFYVSQSPAQNGSFNIFSSTNNAFPVSTSSIERLQFNDVSIDSAQYKSQILNYYQQQWNNAPLKDYTLELTKNTSDPVSAWSSSYHVPDYSRTIIEVKNGQVASVTAKDMQGNTATPDPEFANFTVDKLFSLAQQSIAANDKAEIFYSSRRPYPQSIQTTDNNGKSTYYSAQVKVAGEPEEMNAIAYGTITIGGGGAIPTPVTPPTVAVPPRGNTTTPTTGTTTSGSTPTPVSTTTGHTNSASNTANANRPKIDPQVLTRLLTALIQLIKNMQANNQTNTAHNNAANNNAAQRIRN